jgi:uncharacterized membrane protein YccC
MTTANRDRWTLAIAGFSIPACVFALRTWVAMMTALYAAFWLQLDSASSAAVTVGILAQQTYRVLATVIGVIASFVISGLATQNRELFTIGFAAWLGLCVYVAGRLDGGRAYAAVLSGYTVALVAVTQIDSPQNVFLTGVNRGAAIVVGVAALALVSDIFGTPSLHSGLSAKLAATHQRVRAFALAILDGESAEPIRSANLLREITALRPDIEALGVESSDGLARRAAARSAVVALVSEVSAVGALASLPTTTLSSLRRELGEALAVGLEEQSRVLQRWLQHAHVDCPNPIGALFVRYALELLVESRKAKDAIEALRAGRHPSHRINAPIYRSRRAAVRNGLRAFLVVLISAALLSLGGWPSASLGVARRDDLRQALDIFGCAAAVRRGRKTWARLSARAGGHLIGDAYSALAACDPRVLRQVAADLASAATAFGDDDRAVARSASLDLTWVAFLIDSTPFGLDSHGSTS